jgi:UDP-N-acetylglucosamine 3-dehydrogenase
MDAPGGGRTDRIRSRHTAERVSMTTGTRSASGPAAAAELASRPVRFAVAGAGGMGGTHARNLAGSPEAEVTWVVDLDLPRAEGLVADIGGRATASLEEACAADNVDAVLVALPTAAHRIGVETAARHRKHVFCEKPIARTGEDAEAMVKACEDAGVTFMVGHVVRFFSEYMRIKEILDADTLGRIAMVRASRVNPPVMERSPWFADIEKNGGVVLDLMIHELDTVRWYFGEVERLYAHGLSYTEWHTKRDYSVASLRFRNGVIAHLEASFAHSSWRTSIEIAGQHGLLRHSGDDSATVTFEPTTNIDFTTGVRSAPVRFRPTNQPPHLRELLHFIDCLRTGAPVSVDGREGAKALTLANAVLDSMRTGKPVFFNEDGTVKTA